jgi:tRNA dimethylallyltransferase
MVSAQGIRQSENPLSVILSGPTAAGKTAIAIELATRHSDIEIINADSLLIFNGMDIGTAKPAPQELAAIPHHLINILNPSQSFTAGDYVRLVTQTMNDIHERGKRAILVGGSGFYLKALIYGLWESPPADFKLRGELEKIASPDLYAELFKVDQESALRIGVNDRYRLVRAIELVRLTGKSPSILQTEQNRTPRPDLKLLVIDRPNEELSIRIRQRSQAMLEAGFVEEVRSIRSKFGESRALTAVGYAQVCAHLDGLAPQGRPLREGILGLQDEIELATRQLVKRQRTWFKSEKSATSYELERDHEKLRTELNLVYGP